MKTLFRLIPVFLFIIVLGCGVGDGVKFPSSNPIGPPPEGASGDRTTTTAYVAELLLAPAGTEIRVNTNDGWVVVPLSHEIQLYSEIHNAFSEQYQVRLYPEAVIEFEDPTSVLLEDIEGDVVYLNDDNEWVSVSVDGEIIVSAVRTKETGGVSVTCSLKGAFPPPPPPDSNNKE